jgi:hypothetical protein
LSLYFNGLQESESQKQLSELPVDRLYNKLWALISTDKYADLVTKYLLLLFSVDWVELNVLIPVVFAKIQAFFTGIIFFLYFQ